jgi:hypothetical protein
MFIPGLYAKDVMLDHLNLPPGEISSPHVFQVSALLAAAFY